METRHQKNSALVWSMLFLVLCSLALTHRAFAEDTVAPEKTAESTKEEKRAEKEAQRKKANKRELQAQKKRVIEGSLSNRYIFRKRGSSQDQDLETVLTVNFDNPEKYPHVSASAMGGAITDLDSKDNADFSDVYNTFSSRAVGRLYHAYVDIKKFNPVDNARFGRQHLYKLEPLYFDGVTVDSAPYLGFVLSGFGGSPVHQFENQLGINKGDWLAGGSLQWNPVAPIRLRIDETHLKDTQSAFRMSQGDYEDDLLGASLWVDIGKHFDVFSRFTTFLDELRDAEVAGSARFPEHKLTLRTRLYRLLKTYDIRVVEWDAYNFAGAYVPYNEVSLNVTKGLGEKFSVDSGFVGRFLDDRQTASAFNHGFLRGFLSLASYGFLHEGLDLNATADYYRGTDNTLKNNSAGFSFDAAQQLFDKRLKLGLGTAYYLYRYNLLAGNEAEDVQTYFGSIDWALSRRFKLRGSYEFEHNSVDNFQTMRASFIWNFVK